MHRALFNCFFKGVKEDAFVDTCFSHTKLWQVGLGIASDGTEDLGAVDGYLLCDLGLLSVTFLFCNIESP